MVKPILLMILILILAFLFFLLVTFGEDSMIDSFVSTGPNMTLDAWRESFRYWAQIGIAIAAIAALTWFVLGQWFTNMNYWATANKKRTAWLGLFLVAGLAVIPGLVLTPTAQEWGRLAWAFYILNNLGLYYLATVLFSPSSFKYVPWLSMRVRYW
jgi:hypothetical protein